MDLGKLAKIMSLVAQMEAIKAGIEGLKADNDLRASGSNSPAYTFEDFEHEAVQLRGISDELNRLV